MASNLVAAADVVGRDKLLKLAELRTSSSSNSSSSKKSTPEKNIRKGSSKKKQKNLDLSFTENIEHLVKKKLTIIDNDNDNAKGDRRRSTTTQECRSPPNPNPSDQVPSGHRHHHHKNHLDHDDDEDYGNNDHPSTYYAFTNHAIELERPEESPERRRLSEFGHHPENDQRHQPPIDLYAKYREFLRSRSLDAPAMRHRLRRNNDYGQPQQQRDLSDRTFKPVATVVDDGSKIINHRIITEQDDHTAMIPPVHRVTFNDDQEPGTASATAADKKKINGFLARMNAFIMNQEEEEDGFVDSPKRILHKPTEFMTGNGGGGSDDGGESSSQSTEFPLLNNPDLLEKIFLADGQKNSVLSIRGSFGSRPPEAAATNLTVGSINNIKPVNKSTSCDTLVADDGKSPSVRGAGSNFKSESDLTANKKNDLSRLGHLEEEPREAVQTDGGLMNRLFWKRFSIRGYSVQSRTKPTAANPDSNSIIASSLHHRSEPSITNASDDPPQQQQQQQSSSIEPATQPIIDINQNRIDQIPAGPEDDYDVDDDDKTSSFSSPGKTWKNGGVGPWKLSPRETRKSNLYRKSSRRTSRKHIRLKRSQTQLTMSDQTNVSDGSPGQPDRQSQPTTADTSLDRDTFNNPSNVATTATVVYAEAILDCSGTDTEDLSFKAGDLIEVTDRSHKQWWWGVIRTATAEDTRYGWFPSTYVRLKVSQEEECHHISSNGSIGADDMTSVADHGNGRPVAAAAAAGVKLLLTTDQIRANIVLEIINTERDFVKNLKDVIDGYLKPCRDRKDMFDETRISTIFGNIEELYRFQSQFLSQLEQCIRADDLSQSRIGDCFLQNEQGFMVYCEFCKNHPLATNELQDLYADHKYVIFFEGCRLLQNMIDISLDGFLLTPIQKICKYPLQLAELLKYTKPEHEDHQPVAGAHRCMQRVARVVNERKSRFESLEKLLAIQDTFESWDGPPLLDSCSLLIHTGDLNRITNTSGWSKELTLFLFDHLLILAKKDTRLLKKRTHLFKSRILLDYIDPVVALEDHVKDAQFNIVTRNAFKFFYRLKQKWYLFQAKTAQERDQWIAAFADERRRTTEDQEQGYSVSENDKKNAMLAHQNQLKPRKLAPGKNAMMMMKKPGAGMMMMKMKKPDTVIADLPPPVANAIDRNRAGSLPSYIHHAEKHLILYGGKQSRQSAFHTKKSGASASGSRSAWFQLSNKNKNRAKRQNVK